MIILPPKTFHSRRARLTPPPTIVVAVRLVDEITLVWSFSAPVTITGGGGPGDPPCPQLQANDGVHGWVGADAVEEYDADGVIAYYPSGTALDVGNPYRSVTPPANLAIAIPLELPQAGAVSG